jgi:hypothetical protein
MLNLFLKFLSYIIHNLIKYLATSKDEATFQKVFQTYLLFRRLDHYLEGFSRGLAMWQRDRGHGGAWSGCQGSLRLINHVMHLLDSDLWQVNGPLASEEKMILRCKLRGGPIIAKFDIFDIWVGVIEQNAVEYFCDWVSDHSGQEVTRTVYIPNHSLLIPAVKLTSELTDFTQSQWRQIDFDFLGAIDEDLNRQALTFLPELPPEFPINTEEHTRRVRSFYAKAIIVPQQEQELIEIINEIQRDVAKFRITVNNLRDALIAQATNEPERLLKVL